MKIKVTQLTSTQRDLIAWALFNYANELHNNEEEGAEFYAHTATAIRHGELLLCEYQYNEQEG